MNNKNELKYQEFYNYIIKVLSISKIGMIYSSDPYALDNYKQIHDLSIQMLENFEHVKFDSHEFFRRNIYPTPNVSIRVAIFNENEEILMVRETSDHGYALPGGWCDLYDSPIESAQNECLEEAGVKIKNIKFIGIFNRTPFKQIPNEVERKTVPEYLILVKADLDQTYDKHDYETDDVRFFSLDKLPKFSSKISDEEWNKLINCASKEIITIE